MNLCLNRLCQLLPSDPFGDFIRDLFRGENVTSIFRLSKGHKLTTFWVDLSPAVIGQAAINCLDLSMGCFNWMIPNLCLWKIGWKSPIPSVEAWWFGVPFLKFFSTPTQKSTIFSGCLSFQLGWMLFYPFYYSC